VLIEDGVGLSQDRLNAIDGDAANRPRKLAHAPMPRMITPSPFGGADDQPASPRPGAEISGGGQVDITSSSSSSLHRGLNRNGKIGVDQGHGNGPRIN
jgi:hypothetical protein